MRVIIVNTRVPFVRGGAEALERGLKEAFIKAGHVVDVVRIHETWGNPNYILTMILQARTMEITSLPLPADLVITLKFPSFHVRHERKVVWLLHHYRQFYDLWDTPFGPAINEEIIALRETVINADTLAFREAEKLFTISKTVADRVKQFNHLEAEVLYPPHEEADKFHCKEYGDYIFFPSRLSPIKRHELAIEAMRFVKSSSKLIIAGGVEDRNYLSRLEELIAKWKLEDRVVILTNLSFDHIVKLYSKCRAVVFPSFREDYGYVTLEAMYSKKAVITCTDSGGPTEFVEDGINGFVVPPDPREIAEVIERLFLDNDFARRLGLRGYEKVKSLDLSWDKVVDKLCNA